MFPKKLIVHSTYILLVLLFLSWQVFTHERIRTKGEVYKFRVVGFDPYDPLRGRYLQIRAAIELDFSKSPREGNYSAVTSKYQWTGQKLHSGKYYVLLAKDDNGYALPVSFSLARPTPDGATYIKGVELLTQGDSKQQLRLTLPLDRYYLDEAIADEVDENWASLRDRSFLQIRTGKNGAYVVEGIFIDEVPLEEYPF